MGYEMIGIDCEIRVLFFISPKHTQSFRSCTFSRKSSIGFYTMKGTAKRTKSEVGGAVSFQYCFFERKNNGIAVAVLNRSKVYFAVFTGKYFNDVGHESATGVFLHIFKSAVLTCNNYCMSAASYPRR